MSAPAKVRVHIPFPPIGDDNRPNFQSKTWEWVPCLDIPADLLINNHFSLKPYKWIRYATGVVVGAEGHLSCEKDRPNDLAEHLDYEASYLQDSAGDLYYHPHNPERERMFPTDPQLVNSTISSSVTASRLAGYRNLVIARDGACVVTNYEADLCDAAHLFPHSKGDEYITNFTTFRSRQPSDRISSINDIRNLLLLHNSTHRGLGKDVAFLATPNFAMETIDVLEGTPNVNRCTVHLFPPARARYLLEVQSGSAVRVADRDWPPSILLDAVYACAIMEHFSASEFKTTSAKIWKDHFYPESIMTSRRADQKNVDDERNSTKEKINRQEGEHGERDRNSVQGKEGSQAQEPDNFDLLMMVPYINFSDNQLKGFLEAEQERASVAERERMETKVNNWREQLQVRDGA